MLAFLWALTFLAEASGPAAVPPAPAPAPASAPAPAMAATAEVKVGPLTETQGDEAFRIGKLVRCPVCQGMSIAESPSQMAQDMMKKTRELVADGKSEPEILAYFEERYGEFARLSPRTDDAGLIVWVLPPVLGGLALLWVLRWTRRSRGVAGAGASGGAAGKNAATGGTAAAAPGADPYLEAIRKEVNE